MEKIMVSRSQNQGFKRDELPHDRAVLASKELLSSLVSSTLIVTFGGTAPGCLRYPISGWSFLRLGCSASQSRVSHSLISLSLRGVGSDDPVLVRSGAHPSTSLQIKSPRPGFGNTLQHKCYKCREKPRAGAEWTNEMEARKERYDFNWDGELMCR